MIFVTTGTHHQPFHRLIRAARALDTGEEVVVQQGVMPPEAWRAHVARARVVVCHAGPATIEAVAACGKVPIVVPRRALWREHVDDHQVAFARRIADRVHVVLDPNDLAAAIAAHDAVVAALPRRWEPGVNPAWTAWLARELG